MSETEKVKKELVLYNQDKRPPTEVALFELQKKYKATGCVETWKEMFELCASYTKSLLLKKLKGKKFLDPEIVNDSAIEATINFMAQYKDKEKDFEVLGSFAGMINWKIVESLYKDKKEDDHISFEQTIKETKTVEESLDKIGFEFIMSKPKEVSYFKEIIDQLIDKLERDYNLSARESVIIALYFLLEFKEPTNKAVIQKFNKVISERELALIETYKEELRKIVV